MFELWRRLENPLRQTFPAALQSLNAVRRDSGLRMLVFVDSGSGNVLALDLNPPPESTYAQVVAINHDPPQLIVLSPSFRDWFEELVARFESGRYAIREIEGVPTAIDLNEEN